jgi:TonB family protein
VLSRKLLLALLTAGLLSAPALAQARAASASDEGEIKTGWRPEFIASVPKDKMRAAFPKTATVTGRAVLDCFATADGHLNRCRVAREFPEGQGFGEAALSVVGYERIKPRDDNGTTVEGRPVRTNLEFLAPGDSNPDWLRKPSGADLASVLPGQAAKKGIDGRAVIRCRTTVEGFLEACRVLDETPKGYAFGQAALQLAPQFRMTPKIRAGKAVPGDDVTIPINWKMNGGGVQLSGNSLVLDPPWAKAPTEAEVMAAWPKVAAGLQAGQTVLRCDLGRDGLLKDCDVISENPRNKGFGKAARTLTKSFQVSFSPDEAAKLKTLTIDLPFRFRDPALPDARKLTKPRWVETLSPEGMALVYPEAAAKAGVKTGNGSAACLITAEGRLVNCEAAHETPTGLDFGAAAVKAASVIRMNPWTKEGDPVEGLKITIPFLFALADEAAKPDSGGKP